MRNTKNRLLEDLKKLVGSNRIRKNEPMALHTTLKVGGPAEIYFETEKVEEIIKGIAIARRLKTLFFILGGGSNILVCDKGLEGLVIKNNCRKFSVMNMTGKVKDKRIKVNKALIFAESGVIMNQLVRFTIEQGLGGLEYQLGLPGTVGGAVFMNSNFPKKDTFVGDNLYSAQILTEDGKQKEVDRSYFKFAYDKSYLQKTGEIVLSVNFKLLPNDKKKLWERGMQALEYRNHSQPKGATAGCVFRNISLAQALSIPTPDRITSAGYLIEKAGLKGKRVGDAMVSDVHANFIVNTGKALSEDVIGLINLIKNEVFKKFGVKLELEIKTIGFE